MVGPKRAGRTLRSKPLAVSPKRGLARTTAPLPTFVAPELATLVAEPPEGSDWLHEIKYDGYRAIAAVAGERCRIYTRSGQDWTDKFAPIATALRKLKVASVLLDGEIVVLDAHGRSKFQLLQSSLKDGDAPLTYYVFDILELDGRDLRAAPLRRRKEILRNVLQGAPEDIRYSEDVEGHGDRVLAHACRLGLEGIVSKQADKPYESRRTFSWLKCKCLGNEEFVIGGYRLSDKKGRAFASLLVGEFVGDRLHYRGRVGTGFDATTLDELGARLRKLRRKTSPFVDAPRLVGRDVDWVEPRLVAQVAFSERTKDGLLRQPAFLGLRGDKPASEVQAQAATTMAKVSDADEIAGIRLSTPERILFGAAGLTKLDLANYFSAVSERLLPHAADRPISLVRCPDGVDGERFYQKHYKKGLPNGLKGVPLKESDGKKASYLMVDDVAGLVSIAQISGIEIHPWGARIGNLEHPERLIFDLDPDTSRLGFADVCEAARDVRRLLQAADLESFALLTGGKGIHVIVPLDGRQDWDTVKGFARGLAEKLATTEPERFVATMSKAKRRGRIFIDWLRNERGATAIAPYSPRARPEASVATPVAWTELSRIEAANAFTIATVLQRIKRKGDPWASYSKTRQRISRQALRFFT